MSLEEIKNINKNNFVDPLPDEVEKFKEIFEDFEQQIKNKDILSVEKDNIWKQQQFFIWSDYIGYFFYKLEKDFLELEEIASSNMNLFQKEQVKQIFYWDVDKLSGRKVSYFWIFMMKKLVDIAKRNNVKMVKISRIEDTSAGFYRKTGELFVKMWLIKSYDWPKIEKIENSYMDWWEKNIYWYL